MEEKLLLVRRHMKTWPLFSSHHEIAGKDLESAVWLGYRTETGTYLDKTGWDVNIIGDIFYILDIRIERGNRGKGFGGFLYEVLTNIARELGCKEIRQTPSGWTFLGETRMNYLLRRGWIQDGSEAFRSLEKIP